MCRSYVNSRSILLAFIYCTCSLLPHNTLALDYLVSCCEIMYRYAVTAHIIERRTSALYMMIRPDHARSVIFRHAIRIHHYYELVTHLHGSQQLLPSADNLMISCQYCQLQDTLAPTLHGSEWL
jgi:hypothetical protein